MTSEYLARFIASLPLSAKRAKAKGAFPKKDASAQSYPGTSVKLA
ncbi:hypothetical protein AGRO_1446 [Agrobacterium sp. ATCC 31749]|nr:hypothetical protein AGRO_1446 [Agrobacterium sp. ATCC 31749]